MVLTPAVMTARATSALTQAQRLPVPTSAFIRATRLPLAEMVEYCFARPFVIVTSSGRMIKACAGNPPETYWQSRQ
jgi:hypothetical protein